MIVPCLDHLDQMIQMIVMHDVITNGTSSVQFKDWQTYFISVSCCESQGNAQPEGIEHLLTLIKSYIKTIDIFKQ